jgi:Mor family transcriptional regulator
MTSNRQLQQIKLSQILQVFSESLDEALTELAGHKIPFSLVIFNNAIMGGELHFASNGNRANLIKGLNAMLKHLEEQEAEIK